MNDILHLLLTNSSGHKFFEISYFPKSFLLCFSHLIIEVFDLLAKFLLMSSKISSHQSNLRCYEFGVSLLQTYSFLFEMLHFYKLFGLLFQIINLLLGCFLEIFLVYKVHTNNQEFVYNFIDSIFEGHRVICLVHLLH